MYWNVKCDLFHASVSLKTYKNKLTITNVQSDQQLYQNGHDRWGCDRILHLKYVQLENTPIYLSGSTPVKGHVITYIDVYGFLTITHKDKAEGGA